MQRQLILSKFRNLGFDQDCHLVLNYSLEKGKMGDVVTIIGQNNAGKSNILDALCKFPNGKIETRDVTDLSFDDKDRRPSISIVVKGKDFSAKKTIDKEKNNEIVVDLPDITNDLTEKDLLEFINDLYVMSSNFGQLDPFVNNLYRRAIGGAYDSKESLVEVIKDALFRLKTNGKLNFFLANTSSFKNNKVYKTLKQYIDGYQDLYLTKIGFNPFPTVYRYEEQNISSKELRLNDLNQVSNHAFFAPLLKKIGISVETLNAVSEDFRKSNNNQVFKKINSQLTKKMESINKIFNDLYFAGNDKYVLSLEYRDDILSFGLGRGKDEDPININYQSTGFRWFFNFFFSFLLNNKIQPGSIVVMDEPAHNLHPEGQRELHNFMKYFAKENDITFVIATHSPFLIDIDYLDELRVVSMVDNKSRIDNLFSAVNGDDPDSLLPIKESLTIKQNVFYDLDTTVVWVEGITDYNYLTMFKKLLKKKNIAFLPFNGVGNTKEKTHEILSKILKIKFHKCEMLVDDDKAGKDMLKQCEETDFKDRCFSVAALNTGNEQFMTIEDLFSEKDKAKYPALDYKNEEDYKKAHLSSYMKRNCSLADFDKKTINNFEKLFKILEE